MLAACSRSTAADVKPQATTAASPAQPAQSTTAPGAAPAAPAAVTKPVPPVLPEIVAKVNGEPINKTDLENAVKGLEGRAGGPVPPDQRDRVYRGVLDDLISYRLLLQEVKVPKIAVPDAEVEAQIAKIRGQFQSEENFKQALAAQNVTLEAVRENARTEMAVEKLLESEVGSKVSVTPEAIADFYAKNQDKFQQGERARASHILISIPQNADAATKQQAKTKAEAILTDLKSGKDFATLAKENSQDPGSAPNGGDLGFFAKGQMVPAFDQAVFALKPGETSGLVETPFGFHIIKLVEKQPARTVPLEESKQQIEQYLVGQNRRASTQEFVNALKAKAKIEILI